jgi:hypothetical protein
LTPARLLSTAAGMLIGGDVPRAEVLREVGQLIRNDAHRKRMRRNPVYVDQADHADGGETEVMEEAAVS